MDEGVVEESADIEEDRLCVEEELGEEREVLGVELVFLAVELVDGVSWGGVDGIARRRRLEEWTDFLDIYRSILISINTSSSWNEGCEG